MKVDFDPEDIEIMKFVLGIFNTKDETEEAKVAKTYKKLCDITERMKYKGSSS